MAKTNLRKSQRLEALGGLLAEIASGIRTAQDALVESEGSGNTVALVVDSLGRLGWMADQGCAVASDEYPPVVGDAHAWLRSPPLQEGLGEHAAK
jgi:hypothetical protein